MFVNSCKQGGIEALPTQLTYPTAYPAVLEHDRKIWTEYAGQCCILDEGITAEVILAVYGTPINAYVHTVRLPRVKFQLPGRQTLATPRH